MFRFAHNIRDNVVKEVLHCSLASEPRTVGPMTEPSLMTLVVLGADLPVSLTMSLFVSVDLFVANRISPLLFNLEVAIGANSYLKTGRLLINDAWINQVSVVHLKSQGRCGKHM